MNGLGLNSESFVFPLSVTNRASGSSISFMDYLVSETALFRSMSKQFSTGDGSGSPSARDFSP